MQKIDIHSHILSGLDDGARNEEMSLRMLKMADADGITDIITTPHFHYRRGHAAPDQIRETALHLQRKAENAGLTIKIHTGNELYYTHELIEIVKAGDALTLAESDYVLLEFSPETERRKIQNAVYQFLSEGYFPIIAHMERYHAFQKYADFTLEIAEMGAYYQLNAGSLMGAAGWGTKRFAKSMMKNGMIQFVATDTHDEQDRPPRFGKAADWIEKKYGESEVFEYLCKNPQMILKNKAI